MRLCIELDGGGTLDEVMKGGALDVPVTAVEIEDGVLATRFRVGYVESLGPFVAHGRSDGHGPVLRLWLHPPEE